MSFSQRIDKLFGVGQDLDQAVEPPDLSKEVADSLARFGISVAEKPGPAAAAVRAWLDTPNPTFGGCCPRAFLNGTDDQKAFLDGVLSSLEDGAFS